MARRSRLSRKGKSGRKQRMRDVFSNLNMLLSPYCNVENFDKIEDLYGGESPDYLNVVSEKKIVIAAAPYEGGHVQKVVITPKDVIEYNRPDNPMGCAGMSGVRTLAGFTTDWRMVDNMAKEALEIFKIINRDALNREAAKHGMELK